ncbi:MAG: hypothetical protein HYX91_02475 [Chloroflexi bacterium]|nr:hypothetical protein [Chloroflexota bacterium]
MPATLELPKKETPVNLSHFAPATDEIIAYCPKCKTFETLWFAGDRLLQTRKFSQDDIQVYHDCGIRVPCRLYRSL